MRDVLEFWIILQSHPEIEISFKFIPKILMSKECIHFFGPLCITACEEFSWNRKCKHQYTTACEEFSWNTKYKHQYITECKERNQTINTINTLHYVKRFPLNKR